MFDILESCLDTPAAHKADIVQLRGQTRLMTTCKVKNSTVETFSTLSLSGMGARVRVDNRSWGFSSTNVIDEHSVQNALQNAIKLAKTASHTKSKEITLEPVPIIEKKVATPVKKSVKSVSPEDIVDIVMLADKSTQKENIVNTETTFISMEDSKYFVSSEGSRIKMDIARVMLFVSVVAKYNGKYVPTSDNVGHTGGMELFDVTPPHVLGENVASQAEQLLHASLPPSGKLKVVIHPTLCATLLHEAIGHPLEADLAMAGGGFGSQLGEKVSSPLITIYDDGGVSHGLGQLFYDDEGVSCERTDLIRHGVLTSFMHDRESAAVQGVPPTGNGHAWDYSVEPLIRQTNIGIDPGDYTIEEMVADIDTGLFLNGTFGGQANSNADFTFGFQSASRIEKGEITELLRGANVAGNAIDVFKTIDAVGKKDVLRPGACGKGQFAVQGRIVPAIRCHIMVGGGGE
ncbi:MAG: TldD/PmbA family protein [Candidatus Methanofastidiosia archaeon]|jgi:TldD protein